MPNTDSHNPWPNLGNGVGLRTDHFGDWLHDRPKIGWLEALTENYLGTGGRPRHILLQLAEHYPIVLHGVSLSIGGSQELDWNYLKRLKELAKQTQARWISDHLCWTGFAHHNLHDLLPLPLTEESLVHVSDRVEKVQEFLGQSILLENPSSYASFQADAIPEAEFLKEVATRSGCGVLLDVNNVYVSSHNHGLDPHQYIDTLAGCQVGQYHIAGHTKKKDYILDSHIGPVPDPVWDLYRYALKRIGPRSTLLEWDDEIPELATVLDEVKKCDRFQKTTHPEIAPLREAEL